MAEYTPAPKSLLEACQQIESNPHVTVPLVGLSGRAGCGKSTLARLIMPNHTVIKMAGALKCMLRALGLRDEELEGPLKESPCDLLLGQTPRHAMQTLGTEWGRDCIGPQLWINAWCVRARKALDAGVSVVCDDVRFPNEAKIIRAMGGIVVRIDRDGVSTASAGHASETSMTTDDFDVIVRNEGSVEEFAHRAKTLIGIHALKRRMAVS